MASSAARGGAAGVAGLALTLAGLAIAAAAPAEAALGSRGGEPRARAAILFLPWLDGDRALLRELAARRVAVGSVSPTVGAYAPEQALLDIGQAARVPLASYGAPPPRLALEVDGDGRVVGWARAVARARAAPGEVVPGVVAEVARRDGVRVAYAGPHGSRNAEAAVAADRSGRVGEVALFGEGGFASASLGPWQRGDLLIVRLPAGAPGLAALDRILVARRPADVVVAVRAPPPGSGRPPLLAAGIAGPGFMPGESFESATTRRPGLAAATDLAPTVLDALAVRPPRAVQGRAIAPAPAARTSAVVALHDRLMSVLARRRASLMALLAGWLAVLGALAAARGREGAWTGGRLGLLAALWLPGVALAAAALAPRSVGVEAAVVVVGSLGLAALTDRWLPWPAGPALPAASVLAAYTVDLAAGSGATALAVTGPNPAAGARFYGLGNELEIVLSLTLLLGVGAGLSAARAGPRAAALGFGAAGLVGALVMGAGRLGADVGAVVTLGAGAAAATASALPAGRARWTALALVVLAPLAGLGMLALVDSVTAGGAHLSGVIDASEASQVAEVVRRRIGVQIRLLSWPGGALLALASLGLIAAGIHRRAAILRPLHAGGARPLAAALAGSVVAVLAGAAGNDSATDMLAVGAVVLPLAAGYAGARPRRVRDTARNGAVAPHSARR